MSITTKYTKYTKILFPSFVSLVCFVVHISGPYGDGQEGDQQKQETRIEKDSRRHVPLVPPAAIFYGKKEGRRFWAPPLGFQLPARAVM